MEEKLEKTKRKEFDLEQSISPASEEKTTPVLEWLVRTSDAHENYMVDLRGFLPTLNQTPTALAYKCGRLNQRTKDVVRPIKEDHLPTIQALSDTLRKWTVLRRFRSVYEELSKLRWLFLFLDDLKVIRPALTANVALFTPNSELATDFVQWLRNQDSLGANRMNSIYMSVARAIRACVGTSTSWPPTPFSSDIGIQHRKDGYTEAQYLALLRMCKAVISDFMSQRQKIRAIWREIEAIDPQRRKIAYQAATPERWKYQIRNMIIEAREAFNNGHPPKSHTKFGSSCLVPTADLVAAIFLLSMLRSGVNEQPLLDIKPSESWMPGEWLQPNPFGPEYRNIVVWKNRTGSGKINTKKKVCLSFRQSPTFYPVKLLRYQELIGGWCRRSIKHCDVKETRKSTWSIASERAKNQFWIYWGEGKWRFLKGNNARSCIDSLIKRQAKNWPDLINPEGEPIKYSARLIRDAYLEFVLKYSGFSINTAQQELTHNPDSQSIQNYLKRKWVRTYADDQFRSFQSAANAILYSDESNISPELLRRTLGKNVAGEKSTTYQDFVKVQPGFWCADPSNPPKHIHKKRDVNDLCAAEKCFDCQMSHCFTSSLPEIINERNKLLLRRDSISAYLWNGSASDIRLHKLIDIIERFPEEDRRQASKVAEQLDIPLLIYATSS